LPALPSPGTVVKLVLKYHQDDGSAENIQYYSYTTASHASISDLSGLWGHIATDFLAAYVGSSLAAVVMDSVTLTDLVSSTGAVYSTTPSFTGTNTGSVLPASAAVVVSHTIARRYRGGHPRTYMMVGSASDFATSSVKDWQASFLTNIQNGWNSYQALFPYNAGLGTWNRVNVSYYETVGGVRTVRATPLVDLISADVAKVRVSSQRRRLGKVGG
jgi:hypothetical protein